MICYECKIDCNETPAEYDFCPKCKRRYYPIGQKGIYAAILELTAGSIIVLYYKGSIITEIGFLNEYHRSNEGF